MHSMVRSVVTSNVASCTLRMLIHWLFICSPVNTYQDTAGQRGCKSWCVFCAADLPHGSMLSCSCTLLSHCSCLQRKRFQHPRSDRTISMSSRPPRQAESAAAAGMSALLRPTPFSQHSHRHFLYLLHLYNVSLNCDILCLK